MVGLRIEAWDKDLIYDNLVGSAITDADGAFEMQFDQFYFQELFADQRPDLFFKVFRGGELIKSTKDSVLWNVEAEETKIIIVVDLPAEDKPFLARGQIRQQDGRLLAGGGRRRSVRTFDRGLRSDELLGDGLAGGQGTYEITYVPRAEKKHVNLIVRTYMQQGSLLGESDTIFNAGQNETVDLVVQPPPPEREPSE